MTKIFVVFLFATVCCIKAINLQAQEYSDFVEYEKKFNLNFKNEAEREYRFTVFMENLKEISRLNKEYPEATFGITSFTHLTKEEFSRRLIPSTLVTPGAPEPVPANFSSKAPVYFDWRSKNVVTSIKNQEDCGDCYAFATAAAVESHIAIKTRAQLDLSEQQILDCDSMSKGCKWGYLYTALDIAKNTGLVQDSTYPYEDRQGSCKALSGTKQKISGNKWLPKDENVIADAVYTSGPLPFIMVCPGALQHYTGGVFSMSAETCNANSIGNHIPLIIGYSSDYWIVKNSWGTNWGEKGFFRIKKGINACDLTMEARSIF
jgi:C1A family cysteine protease